MSTITVQDRIKGAIYGSFAGDALSLGAHWVYDSDIIREKIGKVTKYLKPELTNYHITKNAGDLTGYGDQVVFLLDSIQAHGGFDKKDWAEDWRKNFSEFSGYKDHAGKVTLENFVAGKPLDSVASDSADLGGAVRIAPLVAIASDEDTLVKYAKDEASLTHNSHKALISSEYFARVVFRIIHKGQKPSDALKEVAAELNDPFINGLYAAGSASASTDDEESVRSFGPAKEFGGKIVFVGKSCDTDYSVPGIVHFVSKYENSLQEALEANVAVGGDNASRGLIIGLLLGAYYGVEGIPKAYIDDLTIKDKISSYVAKFVK